MLTGEPLAHVTRDGRTHLLYEHLKAVGRLAAEFAPREDMKVCALLTGLCHDLGKLWPPFQFRIRTENGFEAHLEGEATTVRDHSTAGALWLLRVDPRLRPLAMAIAGHHCGLPNLEKFKARVQRREKRAIFEEILSRGIPKDLLEIPSELPLASLTESSWRSAEIWVRMLFSVLCDADFLDTEAFFNVQRSGLRHIGVTMEQLANALNAFLDHKQSGVQDTEVNRVRREVLSAVLAAAPTPPGVFSLTVPTGGGKTLTSMAFALEHARVHGHRRVIVAIPYTSIIEQNAAVYREAFGAHGGAVIEHHSAVDPRCETARNRVASENWDAPVVVTTTVQLLESLFANRPLACRKLHNMAHSVIVLDEAQTLPPSLLPTILDGLGMLVEDYGCSLVISTATQPALGRRPNLQEGFSSVRELVPAEVRAFERLHRVKVRWPASRAPTPYSELAQAVAGEQDVLAVVHQREDARRLCEQVDALLGDTGKTLHLSALMCPEHRSQVLAEIKARKTRGEPVRLVATQLVEAGVDLDFRVVYRSMAGLDALAQAAGRCNREGRMEGLGELRIYEAETPPPPGVLRTAMGVTRTMLALHPELDLFAPESFRRYFERLYSSAVRDDKDIQAMREEFRFSDVADNFKLVEDDWSAPVVVPYEGCEPLLDELRQSGPSRDCLRRLQRFTVTVKRSDREMWLRRGHARFAEDTVAFLGPDQAPAYDKRFGLIPAEVGRLSPR
ncbi:CRISPR-associated endonuclease Cas3'' [Myxococcus sp. CA051A]|uniref:CRISPR-associated endonuclease Cas3'' n=1 Tax=Myxococcus sp. CA051A TaxID=2741739 RepID=UPI00157B92E3|nr:CRISPR-associated endonuclease Cas3'' [Myxococcus sp. CA051A]NTX60341.1 CRISPR-associated endonuclease Cas3'' [Myxococcus sp. CA051A]